MERSFVKERTIILVLLPTQLRRRTLEVFTQRVKKRKELLRIDYLSLVIRNYTKLSASIPCFLQGLMSWCLETNTNTSNFFTGETGKDTSKYISAVTSAGVMTG